MGLISIEGMEFFAYHGCFEEERIIGGRFIVDLSFETDTTKAERTDDLHETVNYQKVYAVVKKEVEIKSKLLEHLARRIADAIVEKFPAVTGLTVKVSKMNPPVGGKTERVSFTVCNGNHKTKN
jgi:7,8-dihydroneopterin aldolase/epimerase/oxygenase